ncbi:MAG TPA: hypothetical protein VK210_05990 [Terriglobia bacterium]|nr:hypothetical protein [Terriglobia bacterium]
MKFYFLVLLFGICLVACTKTETPTTAKEPSATSTAAAPEGQIKPTISLSRERIPKEGWLKMYGKGFSPRQNVQSHLRRPDGTEFREVSILTDVHGEFVQDIDTLLLLRGIHDLWVLDSATGLTSNVAHFDATNDQGPTEKPTHPTL